MCEYAEYNNKDQLICKPYKSLCLFCRQGKGLRYKTIRILRGYEDREEREDEDI